MQAPQWMVEAVAVYRLSLSDSPPSPHPTTSKPPHTTPSPTPTMVKLTGSPNYKMAEINRLVTLVYEHLPLGKDEWERLPSAYKTTRGQNWVECDLDSLRRKFKALYSARKPSGTAEMPPHIKNAKLAKQAIDDNANVVEMDDDADEDQEEDTEQGDEELFVELNFSFEPFLDDQGGDAQAGSDAAISNKSSCEDVRPADTASGDVLAIRSPLSVEATSSIDLRLGTEGLEAFAATPKPSPLPAVPAARQLRSTGLKKPRKAATPRATGLDPTTATKVAKMTKQPAARGFNPGSCDEQEAHRHASLQSVSNRVGGSNLYEFRDGVGAKRARDGEDLDQAEASFAKAKRIRATKTTAALKQKLADLESASSNLGNSPFAMMLLFREENERKSEARRVEEEQRSRDEAAAKEAQLLADKAEAEERRRQDKIEMDERVRRDKEDVRARTQEMMMFIGAIFKKA